MKLNKLTIHSYKNLDGTYSFENNNGYIALIGLNGSGKSNLLEAISIIFDKLINNNGKGIPFDYEIEYNLNGHTYERRKKEAKKDGKICKAGEIEYPSSLIACYSGEDLRLWHTAFEKYHMGYFNEAVRNTTYTFPKFLYVNKYCWKIALIALACSDNEDIKSFIQNTLKISEPSDIEIDFVIDEAKKDAFNTHVALNWFNRITQDGYHAINLNTIATTDIYISGKQVEETEKAKYIFTFLYLLSQPKKNETNKIDKLIEGIRMIVSIAEGKIDFNDLSEGEKKLILIECITKVLGDENSLVLLDEPDAHTHIAMKKDLLKLISEFKGQTVMTTHSPMFLNKRWDGYNENNIYYLHSGKIEDTEPLKHLAELTDGEVDYFDSAYVLGAKNLLIVEGPYDKRYLEKAISIFSKREKKYNKLSNVTILPGNSAGNAKALYDLVLKQKIDKMDNLVYLFDYDGGGYDGDKAIKKIEEPKVKSIFYQQDYTQIIDLSNKPQEKDTIMVEDFFSTEAYSTIIADVEFEKKQSHKDFRIFKTDIASTIKTHIEKHYNSSSFKEEWYDGFRPVLNKLLEVFNLN